MFRKGQTVDELALALLLAAGCLSLRSDSVVRHGVSTRMMQLPQKTLWVWERPEDLGGIDTSSTAIAWLDRTIQIGDRLTHSPRRQSVIYPDSVRRIAVVRIEVQAGTDLSGEHGRDLVTEAVDQIMDSARKPGIAALQIDFDATRSQRSFYTELLRQLRSRTPKELPLSITALASWCSYDDWIGNLPVDEAVPMYFRMEPDRRMAPQDRPEYRIREPLCMGSVGISTRELWPSNMGRKRIYIFADRGWREDLPYLASRRLP